MTSSILLPTFVALALTTTVFAESPAPKPILSEDFESTAVGQIPAGFTKNGAVGVVDDVAHSGKHSLRMDPVEKGARNIVKKGPELTTLGGEHWGRLYFKVKLPVPAPVVPEGKTFAVIHSTLVSGKATSPLFADPIEVRMMGMVLGSKDGAFQYLYNVQPSKRKEFGAGSKYRFHYTDEWTLAEWHIDSATQSFHFYINGEEIPECAVDKGAGKFEGAEIPTVFDSLAFGWTNYQPAGAGFTAWIDDLALSKERIGPLPAAGAAAKK